MKNYYKALDVSEDADETTIKKAYRKLAMEHHPDRNQGNAESEERFKEISEAYAVLQDVDKRREYDMKRKMPEGFGYSGPNIGGINLDDFLREMGFAGNPHQRAQRRPAPPQRGQSVRASFTLDLEDVLDATIKKINLGRMKRCVDCGGSGAGDGPNAVKTCDTCNGLGVNTQTRGGFRMQSTCEGCLGEGKVIQEVCKTCSRSGFQKVTEEVTVRVPAGVKTGDLLRVPGKGHESRSIHGMPGDLHIQIKISDHQIFERDEVEIYQKVQLPYTLCVLGGKVEIPILSNSDVKKREVIVEPGLSTGRVQRFSEMGLPHPRSQQRGDMVVEYEVQVPKAVDLTEEQRDLVEKLQWAFND